nr:hypothetical protein [Candidatus Sigynarchaeota archaeon]
IEDKEGPIAALAKRFHASTRTVQAAKKHDAAWWQERIDEARKGTTAATRGKGEATPPACRVLSLVYYPNAKAYQILTAAREPLVLVNGTIDDALAYLASEGWDVIQLQARGAPAPGSDLQEWTDVLVRRRAR